LQVELLCGVAGGAYFITTALKPPTPPVATGSTAVTQTPTTPLPPPAGGIPSQPSENGAAPSGGSSSGSGSTTSGDGKQTTLIKDISGAGGTIKLDYVQLFTGADAQKEAAKHGETADNDLYVVNENPKIRTFPVSSGVTIVLHPGDGPQYSRDFTMPELVALMGAGGPQDFGGKSYFVTSDTLFYVTIKDGKATRIENIWTP
jgi:hypothetical protein